MKIPRWINVFIALALILGSFMAGNTPAAARVAEAPTAPEAAENFKILSLTADNYAVVDHDSITGDDRGGIATSNSRLFYSGDSATGSFSLDDLSGGVSIGALYDVMISNLKTGQVYLLGNAGAPIPIYAGDQTISELLLVDGEDGSLTGDTVPLDTPIVINTDGNMGLFAGYGRVVLFDQNKDSAWSIATPSGAVTSLAYPGDIPYYGCENWAFWGIAEYFTGQDYLVYRYGTMDYDIVRTRLSDGETTVLGDFDNLSDMCSISANIVRGRWYFHYEGSGQFGGVSETVGYADATFVTTHGFLDGHVYDADTLAPIEDALVDAEGGQTGTDVEGYYTMTLSVGTYDVAAMHPHYTTEVAPSVEIITDTVTTQDFYLTARGRLFGTVTDFDNGFPLAATITADDGTTTNTDPATGFYEMYLDEGTYVVTAVAENYLNGSATVEMVSDQDTQQDFALEAAVSFIPSPVHVTLDWQTTGQLDAQIINRLAEDYDFEFREVPGGFIPLVAPGDFSSRANSPVYLTCVASDPETGYVYAQQNEGNAFYRYDPWEDTWTQLADCPIYSGNNGGAQVLNGKVYTIYTQGGDIGVYDIAADAWTTMVNPLGSSGNIATDGELLYTVSYCSFSSYNPDTDVWTPLASPPFCFEPWGGLDYLDGTIYGHQGNGSTGFARYDVAADTWTSLDPVPDGAVLGSAIDPTARVYYAYGPYGGNNWYAFDLETESWTLGTNPLFYVNDGGLAFVGQAGVSGIYFVEGETGFGFGRFETEPYSTDNIPWLAEIPMSGTIPAGDSLDVSLLFDATTAAGVNQPGDYYGTLLVSGDPKVEVPVTMTVVPPDNMGKVTGTILGSCTGDPVEALIDIAAGDPITQTLSDPATGAYTAWLFEGSYELTFSADLYITQTITVDIVGGETTLLDVTFVPDRPCAAEEPDMLEVWVLQNTAEYAHPTGLDIINNGGQDLQFEIKEISGTVDLGVQIQPARNNNSAGERSGTDSTAPAIKSQSSVMADSCVVAIVAGSGYAEDAELHATLDELGYAWVDVANMQEAYDAGANVFISRYAGSWNPSPSEVDTWLNGGYGYIEMGDWGSWFPDSYTGLPSGTPLNITVADPAHPLAFGLPGTWTGLGFWHYTYPDYLGWVYDTNYPNILQVDYSGVYERVVSAQEYGDGRAVYLGINVYGSEAGTADKQLFENAITWSGDCNPVDVPWVWEVPVSGTVPAESTFNVDILFTSIVTDPLPLGTYTATLQINTNDPADPTDYVPVIMHVVSEFITPTASFEANSPVCLGETVVFTNTTIPGIPPKEGGIVETTYLWNFGDGATSTELNPTHLYATSGTYDVTLEACNLEGMCDSYTAPVEVLPLPEALFTYEVNGLDVAFTNSSIGVDTYLWDFGDGITSTLENPIHTYAAVMTYTVSLEAAGPCGSSVATAEVVVSELVTPTASFVTNSPVCFGEVITFTNTTTPGNPIETSYLWDFGDGITSTEEMTAHLYTSPGVFEVALKACNSYSLCSVYTDTVEVLPITEANFTYVVDGLDVIFTNLSVGAFDYLWEFGDGITSTEENPAYQFAVIGTYTVTLTATGPCGTSVYSVEVILNPIKFYLPVIMIATLP